MNAWERLKNLWRISEFQPTTVGKMDFEQEILIAPSKTTARASFVRRIKETPIEKVTKVANETA